MAPAWRSLLVLAALPALAGCVSDFEPDEEALDAIAACRDDTPRLVRYYLGPGMTLGQQLPVDGAEPGNAFSSGFLTNDLKEWRSEPLPDGVWLAGNVTLEFYARSTGSPAPLVYPLAGSGPGDAYQFYNQVGSDRAFMPAGATEAGAALAMPGTVDHFVETFPTPQGGFVLEQGDRLRLLLTDLAFDSPGGGGHEILFGPSHPSHVDVLARCFPDVTWSPQTVLEEGVTLYANQGLFTGAGGANPANQATYRVELPDHTSRVTIDLRQAADANPAKDDVDIELLDSKGEAAWSIGSPYSDEHGSLWVDNLAALFPDQQFTVVVNSYSGVGYQGQLTVVAEAARSPS